MKNYYLLLMLASASVSSQPLTVAQAHWQEGMAVGVTELSGTLYIRDTAWQWQPVPLEMSRQDTVLAGLQPGQEGMVSESRPGRRYYILKGYTTTLTSARPGLQPSVSLLHAGHGVVRLEARGELAKGQVRYGEITFTASHVLAWQDSATAEKGWSVVSGNVTPDAALEIKHLLWQIRDYRWNPSYSGLKARPDAFTVMPGSFLPANGTKNRIAGARVTSLEDIRVRFPGAEEPVTRWQGNLTPVVNYF
ncbi:fimbrial protein [Salmonella enterica]|uniref:fimbrial protein n=1 Tax=Salmonella enterica TaxID=28901 RepID=UPI001078C1C7|nr:fimbrial protein [Salmonella enterica subsp. enterica serovar Orion]EBW6452850.1 fimbrial protein [Salmonella enterica subsp. enterica serovar Oranienburg]ECD0489524.1 fimbrial protein [Salmonella enterica subsp. enterica serovar Brandenburg]EHJ7851186.1 fimbrial protein [Salmonella enterica]EHQ8870909.1 fimbrial protein [Salmonella enterica]